MENELTLGALYEEIAERLAIARSKALMGERQEALGLFQGASLDYTRFREVLADYPGFHALEHAFQVTMATLCAEQEAATAPSIAAEASAHKPRRAGRPRRKADRVEQAA